MIHTPLAPADSQRLSKVVAAQVPCSRREAEQYIAQGWVRIDGVCVHQPQARVGPGQRVDIDPQARLQPALPATFLIHKPVGMDAQAAEKLLLDSAHWDGDVSGVRHSRAHHVGLKALLPLPAWANGLCLFSQDVHIVRKLTDDAALVEQEFVADVTGEIAPDGLARLSSALVRVGRAQPPARVSWQSEARLRFALKGVDPGCLHGLCEQVGLKLGALRRLRIGRIPLAGLPAGQWRYLPLGERF